MAEIVEKLTVRFDLGRLWGECQRLITRYGLGSVGQMALMKVPSTPVDQCMTSGLGSLMGTGLYERDFTQINPPIKGTYLEQVIRSIPFPTGRCRIMRLMSHRCYSVHYDSSPRVHLPLVTNPDAFLAFPEQSKLFHLPADGSMYLADTRLRHTAMNGGSAERFHIVASLCEPK